MSGEKYNNFSMFLYRDIENDIIMNVMLKMIVISSAVELPMIQS